MHDIGNRLITDDICERLRIQFWRFEKLLKLTTLHDCSSKPATRDVGYRPIYKYIAFTLLENKRIYRNAVLDNY